MHGLFAQFAQPGGAGGGAAGNPLAKPEVLAGVMIVIFAVTVVLLVIYAIFLLTLHRALHRCRPEYRAMTPGLVWLNMIPLFSTFWIFLTVNRIADSLRDE